MKTINLTEEQIGIIKEILENDSDFSPADDENHMAIAKEFGIEVDETETEKETA